MSLVVPSNPQVEIKLPVDVSSLSRITSKPKATHVQKQHVSPGLSLLAGSIAGGVEAAVTYPFEFAKTRAQLKGNAGNVSNPLKLISQVARTEGLGAVYAGCTTLIAGTALKAGVRFMSFDAIKQSLADANGRLSPVGGILAGVFAGCAESCLAVTPTERIKTALIDDAKGEKRFRGGSHAFITILKQSGLRGVYRGLVATSIKQSATSAVRMGTYNILKTIATDQNIQSTTHTTFAMGAVSGLITVYATQPFDTIKTRIQSAKGASVGEAVRDLMSESGIRGFWHGSTMRLGRLVLSGGIVFSVYEQIVQLAGPGYIGR